MGLMADIQLRIYLIAPSMSVRYLSGCLSVRKLPSISSMHNNHLDFNGCYNHFGFCVDFKPYSLNDTFATRSCKMLND